MIAKGCSWRCYGCTDDPPARCSSDTAGDAAPPKGRTSFALFGHEPELAKQNGHRVEIVGSIVPTVEKGAAVVDGIQHVRVGSLKRIAGSCSASSSLAPSAKD